PLRHADRSPSIEDIKQVRALQAQIKCSEDREAPPLNSPLVLRCSLLAGINYGCNSFVRSAPKFGVLVQKRLAFGLVKSEVLPRLLNVGAFEVVNRELQFLLQ